jgi:hypothetical protein
MAVCKLGGGGGSGRRGAGDNRNNQRLVAGSPGCKDQRMKFTEGSGNRSSEQAMSGAARRLVLFWEKWTDGGVAGQSFGCFGTMKEFGDAETENKMGSLACDRRGTNSLGAPPIESAAGYCLRHKEQDWAAPGSTTPRAQTRTDHWGWPRLIIKRTSFHMNW